MQFASLVRNLKMIYTFSRLQMDSDEYPTSSKQLRFSFLCFGRRHALTLLIIFESTVDGGIPALIELDSSSHISVIIYTLMHPFCALSDF